MVCFLGCLDMIIVLLLFGLLFVLFVTFGCVVYGWFGLYGGFRFKFW